MRPEELAKLKESVVKKRKAPSSPSAKAHKKLKTLDEIQKKVSAPNPSQLRVIPAPLIQSLPPKHAALSIL